MSTLTTPRVARPAPPEVHGRASWVIRPYKECGFPARRGSLRITTTDSRGKERSALYLVSELLDTALTPVGWELHKIDIAGTILATHHVDTTGCTTFRPRAEECSCDCADSSYRDRSCRHVRGLCAALAVLEAEDAHA